MAAIQGSFYGPRKPLSRPSQEQTSRWSIEVQVLDHGYTEKYEKSSGKKADWFTTHGDVFPVGSSKMKPFPPVAPNSSRSFPKENRSKPTPEWNHYYIRAINGEVRLWVNGVEVSGGTECSPSDGYYASNRKGPPLNLRHSHSSPTLIRSNQSP